MVYLVSSNWSCGSLLRFGLLVVQISLAGRINIIFLKYVHTLSQQCYLFVKLYYVVDVVEPGFLTISFHVKTVRKPEIL